MIEPVQSLVTMFLEKEGYFVRSNVRYATPSDTPNGRTSAYGDLDIVAIRFDPVTGCVTDRLWGEVKAHLTLSLTPGYLRGFLKDYQLMLDLTRAPLDDGQRTAFALRQQQAFDTVAALLGSEFRRVLYFGGRIPKDGGKGARELLRPDLEIQYVRTMVRDKIGSITHREGNNALCRVLNMLSEYKLIDLPDAVDAAIETE
jgi:hypothetical protein